MMLTVSEEQETYHPYSILQAIHLATALSYEQLRKISNPEKKYSEQRYSELELTINAETWLSRPVQGSVDRGLFTIDPPLDYEQLFDYKTSRPAALPEELEYASSFCSPSDTASETMTIKEAEDTLQEFQYAAVVGTFNDISYAKRRRFALWADLNKAELQLFHHLHALTGEVNYSKVF